MKGQADIYTYFDSLLNKFHFFLNNLKEIENIII